MLGGGGGGGGGGGISSVGQTCTSYIHTHLLTPKYNHMHTNIQHT